MPSWSPDSDRLTFAAMTPDGNWDIYVINADGAGLQRLTSSPGADYTPSWSPDGQRILFSSDRDGDWDLFVMDIHGSGAVPLTNNEFADSSGDWSPDGKQIVFSSDRRDGARTQIFVMNADGSNVRQVVSTSTRDVMPRWAPRKQGISVSESSIIIESSIIPGSKPLRDITAKARSAVVRIETEDAAGSGFIFDAGGHILTNNHVITGAATITVHLDNGTTHAARLIGRDLVHDLAVVKIDAPDLPWLEMGELSTTPLASDVLVLGFPLRAQDIAVTRGLVSAIKWDKGRNVIWIQTDSAINPGNSGGPLMNLQGQVVGVVSSKLVDINVEGVGFAISSNTIKLYLDRLRAGETISS